MRWLALLTGVSPSSVRPAREEGDCVSEPFDLTSGDEHDGVYQKVITFPQFSDAGTWRAQANLCDDLSNCHFYSEADLNAAGWAKKITGKATITVGSVGLAGDFLSSFAGESTTTEANLGELARRFERGDFDLVAVGRALLDDPLWVRKVKTGTLDGGTFTRESLGRYH